MTDIEILMQMLAEERRQNLRLTAAVNSLTSTILADAKNLGLHWPPTATVQDVFKQIIQVLSKEKSTEPSVD